MNATETILDLILENKAPLSTREIAHRLSYQHNTVQKIVRQLYKDGELGRYPGPGNTWLYGEVTVAIKKEKDRPQRPKPVTTVAERGVSLSELEKFLKAMEKKNWVHPLFESQKSLNRAMLRVFQLAYEKATGSDVDNDDLQVSRDHIESLWTKLQQYSDFVSAILKQGYLWDSNTFANWLTENHTAEELRDMVSKAREHN